jgi:NCAIR mutase (PurE)-related protein
MAKDHVMLDTARRERLGIDEAVFCAGKTTEQITVIVERFAPAGATALLTRLSQEQLSELPMAQRERLDYDPVSRTAFLGEVAPPEGEPRVAVVSAGTSDVGVAREAVRTLSYHGAGALEVYDVGVAGLWRLLDRVEELRGMRVVIAVAGMDAALPSVIGGQVPGAVIAVPTSVGYGVAEGGGTALNAALASCAPGVTVVNIDNGYGAACAALRILRT